MPQPAQTCIECGAVIQYSPGRSGYINRCDDCSKPKPTKEQRQKWEADGQHFTTSSGEEIRFEVVKSFKVDAPE